MITLTATARPVRRVTAFTDRGRPVVIRLNPGGKTVTLWAKGERTKYTVTIGQIWLQGARNRAAEIRTARAEKRKDRGRAARVTGA